MISDASIARDFHVYKSLGDNLEKYIRNYVIIFLEYHRTFITDA